MNAVTQVKINGLERQAALADEQAEEAEARGIRSGSKHMYLRELDYAKQRRAQSAQLRAEADQLRD